MREPTAGSLTKQEGAGLVIAAAAHAALLVAFTLSPPGKTVKPPPERMEVTFSEEISQQSTSPDPMAEAAPDVAPELGEAQPDPVVEPQPRPEPPKPVPPAPAPKPQPAPPKPAPKPQPQPKPVTPKPAPPKPAPPRPAPPKPAPPKPAPKVQPKPAPKPAPSKAATPAKASPAKKATADTSPRRRPDAPAGGSRIGSDFLKGVPAASTPGTSKATPATTIGSEVKASLRSEISRQLKPNWASPQGVDVEQLRTIVTWQLNPDGSLLGAPRIVDQLGVTTANRAQAERHKEQALRAIRLSAPFKLPTQFYAGWKQVQFEFNRNLSK